WMHEGDGFTWKKDSDYPLTRWQFTMHVKRLMEFFQDKDALEAFEPSQVKHKPVFVDGYESMAKEIEIEMNGEECTSGCTNSKHWHARNGEPIPKLVRDFINNKRSLAAS
ncbi:hypothetical protein KAI87_16790, partial [Myxococcota bacterium]|nr:hypothetical protein [Myxococcota bacterium]